MPKRLVKQRKHNLSLAAWGEFQKPSKHGRLEIFKYGRFSARRGELESLQFILRTISVITKSFHKLYQQHLERLSLLEERNKKSSKFQYQNVCLLNPCRKLIDVLISIKIKGISQTPVNPCVPSNVEVLAGMITAILVWTNPVLMPHIPKAKSDKMRESPHSGDSKSCQ